MLKLFSTSILLLLLVFSPGCASVESTADYYLPYTTKKYPPKPKDAPIPILGRPPEQPHKVIGRLAFRSDLGWQFMRKSMVYNARVNGADAVVLRDVDSREQINYTYVPPNVRWIPTSRPVIIDENKKKRYITTYPGYIPIMEPGYVRPWVRTIFDIDAEMIVFKK